MPAAAEPLARTKIFSDRIERIEISMTMAVVAEATKLREKGAEIGRAHV